ncbi:MAG: hypothetical protein ACLPVY_21835 [Acidimicrobiia bacterium]
MRSSRVVAVVVLALGSCVAGIGAAGAGGSLGGLGLGLVGSVNGSTATTACGVAGASGTFTLTGYGRSSSQTTVDVTAPTTTFSGWGLTAPTFQNVCVGEMADATGATSGGAVQATNVMIWSPTPLPTPVAFGLVASVNGSTATTACGAANASGTFTVTGREGRNSSQTTVDVTATTTAFTEPDVSGPSFLNVCVGEMVGATGTTSAGALQATNVTIWSPAPPPPPAVAFGLVGSVNGSTATTACGAANASGTFTVTGHQGRNASQTTVAVTAMTTAFTEHDVSTPSFLNVCVGEMVGATGTTASGALQATNVTIWSPKPPTTGYSAFGMVISVNGSTTAGACGVADMSGTFTVIGQQGHQRHRGHNNNSSSTQTVINVTAGATGATTFTERGVSAPSFENVCVNGTAGAQGATSDGALQATAVKIWSPPATPPSTAFGMVISVNGSTATTACGVAAMSGTFTVMGRNSTQTVIDVTANTTTFREHGVSAPSFANVCVNATAAATGTVAGSALDANGVQIWSPPATT